MSYMSLSSRRLLNVSSAPIPAAPIDVAGDAASSVLFDSSAVTVTAFLFLIALFFLAFFSVYTRRFFSRISRGSASSSAAAAQQPSLQLRRGSAFAPAAHGCHPSVVRALPVLCYVGGVGKEGCVVCLSEFEEKERVKVIPRCGHAFHPECIEAWLLSRGSCPICRCSELFCSSSVSSFLSRGGELRLAILELEESEGRSRGEVAVEGERLPEGESKEMVDLSRRRSSSCSWRREEEGGGEEDRVEVHLRRSCSF